MKFLKIENRIFEFIFSNIIKWHLIYDQYRYFLNENEINSWAIDDNKYFQEKLSSLFEYGNSDEEFSELRTFDLYCGTIGQDINNLLRGEVYNLKIEYLREFICELESSLNKFKVSENVISIRRMPSKFIDSRYRKGNTFIERGFLSTSMNLSYREDINAGSTLLENEALLLIKISKGTCAAYIEEAIPEHRQRKEYELLLQKDLAFYIEKNIKILSNRVIILRVCNPR